MKNIFIATLALVSSPSFADTPSDCFNRARVVQWGTPGSAAVLCNGVVNVQETLKCFNDARAVEWGTPESASVLCGKNGLILRPEQ